MPNCHRDVARRDNVDIATENNVDGVDVVGLCREEAEKIASDHFDDKDSKKYTRFLRTAESRPWMYVTRLLLRASDIVYPSQQLFFAVLSQAIQDLVIDGDTIDKQSAVRYFLEKHFEQHAIACGLEPDFVIDTLVKVRLLKRRPFTT